MDDDDPARGTSRRAVLRAAGLGAAVVAGGSLAACDDRTATPFATPGGATARDPAGAIGAAAPSITTPPELPARDVEEVSIAELQARMASGAETARSLVDKYRRRIAALDGAGPTLRSVLELDPDADAQADALDAERKAGRVRGPLHGIPVLVKDNIDTAGRTTTTCGSLALEGLRAPADAPIVARLRAAGAIILGKTNLSEWANFRGLASSSGWSGRGGQCRNPYALDRSPSGSSSGSAVAAAASLCAGAIGTETDGSIVSPASCNGLVGVKPTIGLVPRTGIIPIAASQDTAGPMTRTVADAAALLTVLAGADPADPSTTDAHPARPAAPEDYTRFLDANALRGARLGVPRAGFFGVNRNVDALMTPVLDELRGLGAVLVDPADLVIPPALGAAELEVLCTEFAVQLGDYLRTRPDAPVRSLADLIAWNAQHADRELAIFGQELFEMSAKKGGLQAKAYLDARALCLRVARTELLDAVSAKHQLDGFVACTNGPPWLIDHVNGDAYGLSASMLPAIAGYPHVTVPAGHVRGLPVGLSFFGLPFTDGKLLGYAYAWERATRRRQPPRYLATAAGA